MISEKYSLPFYNYLKMLEILKIRTCHHYFKSLDSAVPDAWDSRIEPELKEKCKLTVQVRFKRLKEAFCVMKPNGTKCRLSK